MNEEARKLLNRADRALEVAEMLMKDGYPSDAASKIYYAMFYATQALLKSEGIDVVKHSAVESAFGYYLAKLAGLTNGFIRCLTMRERSGKLRTTMLMKRS